MVMGGNLLQGRPPSGDEEEKCPPTLCWLTRRLKTCASGPTTSTRAKLFPGGRAAAVGHRSPPYGSRILLHWLAVEIRKCASGVHNIASR